MNISVGNLVLPNKPLSNIELLEAARKLKIPNFRGVSLRDTLPKKPKKKECGILNLDDTSGLGTHWVAWYKNETEKKYFDSYGLQPPNELVDYLQHRKSTTLRSGLLWSFMSLCFETARWGTTFARYNKLVVLNILTCI